MINHSNKIFSSDNEELSPGEALDHHNNYSYKIKDKITVVCEITGKKIVFNKDIASGSNHYDHYIDYYDEKGKKHKIGDTDPCIILERVNIDRPIDFDIDFRNKVIIRELVVTNIMDSTIWFNCQINKLVVDLFRLGAPFEKTVTIDKVICTEKFGSLTLRKMDHHDRYGNNSWYKKSNLNFLGNTTCDDIKILGEITTFGGGGDGLDLVFDEFQLEDKYFVYNRSYAFAGIKFKTFIYNAALENMILNNKHILKCDAQETANPLGYHPYGGFKRLKVNKLIIADDVTTIDSLFSLNAKGTLIIPKSVEFIARNALSNNNFTEVIFEDNRHKRLSVLKEAFAHNNEKLIMHLPETLHLLNCSAFTKCNFKLLEIPKTRFSYLKDSREYGLHIKFDSLIIANKMYKKVELVEGYIKTDEVFTEDDITYSSKIDLTNDKTYNGKATFTYSEYNGKKSYIKNAFNKIRKAIEHEELEDRKYGNVKVILKAVHLKKYDKGYDVKIFKDEIPKKYLNNEKYTITYFETTVNYKIEDDGQLNIQESGDYNV